MVRLMGAGDVGRASAAFGAWSWAAWLAAVGVLAGCPIYGPASDDSTVKTISYADGGSGGSGGAATGGTGGAAGAGGSTPATCMGTAEHGDVFSIDQPGLCLLGKYTAPIEVGYALSPTWGVHGGPLTVAPSATQGSADVVRWMLPAGPAGALTPTTATIPLDIVTGGSVFLGTNAVDLGFANWTLVSWTGDFGTTDGEALLLSGSSVAARQPAAGFFDAVGLEGAGFVGRILHTGLAPLGDPGAAPAAGLYYTDICANLSPCGAGAVATWGEATGPVAVDGDGNAFAVQTSYSTGTLALRGFAAVNVAPGAGANAGVELLNRDGFGAELAAVAPNDTNPGVVFFQPFDSTTFAAGDVIAQPYIAAGALVGAVGAPTTAVHLVTVGTSVSLMTDATGRLWLGAVTAPGSTTFYVIGRDPGV